MKIIFTILKLQLFYYCNVGKRLKVAKDPSYPWLFYQWTLHISIKLKINLSLQLCSNIGEHVVRTRQIFKLLFFHLLSIAKGLSVLKKKKKRPRLRKTRLPSSRMHKQQTLRYAMLSFLFFFIKSPSPGNRISCWLSLCTKRDTMSFDTFHRVASSTPFVHSPH